jgi:hypothetical protein
MYHYKFSLSLSLSLSLCLSLSLEWRGLISLLNNGNFITDYVSFFILIYDVQGLKKLGVPHTHLVGREKIFNISYRRKKLDDPHHSQSMINIQDTWNFPVIKHVLGAGPGFCRNHSFPSGDKDLLSMNILSLFGQHHLLRTYVPNTGLYTPSVILFGIWRIGQESLYHGNRYDDPILQMKKTRIRDVKQFVLSYKARK